MGFESNTIGSYIDSYYHQIPQGTARAVGQSALFSFVISAVMTQSVATSLVLGGIAALASTVHSCTTPVFDKLFNNEKVTRLEESCKIVANLAISQILINALTPFKVNILASSVLNLVVAFVLSLDSNHASTKARVYFAL